MFVKLVVAAVSMVALGCVPDYAQSDATPPAGNTPVAKVTAAETSAPPAASPQTSPALTENSTATNGPAQNNTPAAGTPGPQVLESSPPTSKPTPELKTPESVKNTAVSAPGDPKAAPYVIGPLDVLVVKVWNNQPLSGVYDVHQDGMISMPLVGDIKADGLTTNQLKDVIAVKLGDCCLKTPEVTVEVGKINSKWYYVFGEVGRAGPYPLVKATTVMDALSEVGGFREFANQKKIRIQHPLPDGKAKESLFNYKDVSHGKHLEQNILLQNGDRIFVQ